MNSPQIEALERDIEATRRSLDRTLHDLQFRLSPRQQATRAWRHTKEGSARSLRAGVRWVTASPAPAVILVLGLAAVLCVRAIRAHRHRS